jgi:class 3 adenylate cyclase
MNEKNIEMDIYRNALKIVHRIDKIRDDHFNLRDILRHSLKTINRELKCKIAFIQYIDFYEKPKSLAIDENGLICHDIDDLINSFFQQAQKKESTFFPDQKITGNFFIVTPLIIKKELIGVLGVEQQNPPVESEKILLENAAMILDTAIYNKCKESFIEKQQSVMHSIDDIIDCNLDDFNKCQKEVLCKISGISKAAGVLLFEGSEKNPFGLIAANDLGKIIWKEYPKIVLELKKAVQETMESEEIEIRSFVTEDPELLVAGSSVSTIGAFPLITARGDSGGVLSTISYDHLSKGHIKLIEVACSVLDTNLIRNRRTEMMIKRYKKYVGTDTLDILLKNPEWLNARKENVVILSADLVGSTKYASEEQNAFKTFDLVNRYLTLIARTVMEDFNGTLDKFIGDEVMALFGAPVKDRKAPFTAAECALAIMERVKDFNSEEKKKNNPTFDIKISLGLAGAIIGEIGSEDTQTDYTALGDGVNQVFRMSEFGIPNEIIINDQLKNEIEDIFNVEYIDDVQFRGIEQSKAIYKLSAKKV